MKIVIKETRIITLDVKLHSHTAKPEQIREEVTKQLNSLRLERDSIPIGDKGFELFADGIIMERNKLALCEIVSEPEVHRELLAE